RRWSDGARLRARRRYSRVRRRLAASSAAHVPGHHGAVAVVVRDESFHLRHGAAPHAAPADPERRRARSFLVYGPGASSARADRDRDRLCDHGALPRRAARAARAVRHRSRRRTGARAMSVLDHLPVLPIIVPLAAATVMLLLSESRRGLRTSIALGSLLVQLAVALTLLYQTTDAAAHIWDDGIGVYPIGGWPAPFGIVLVVDRLSAMMLSLVAIVSLSVLVYSLAHWDKPGQPFHSLFQLLVMGQNGAFLTGDLFNLFVFFEILLAASYGLVLRGTGMGRVRTGLHYIAVSLAAAFLFLIGVALMYGTVGTLNMADLLGRVAALEPDERALFDAGAWILGIA